MNSIISGNLSEDEYKGPEKRGWFIGHFIEKGSVFNSNDFEVKWGNHRKGCGRSVPALNTSAKTISILIKGKLAIRFPEKNKEIILSKIGDFSFHNAGIYHTSEALDDTVVITIRWPSVPGDQKIKETQK